MKYSREIVKRIAELVEKDSYTVVEICAQVGISKETYYQWLKSKPDFPDAIKKAKDRFDENLVAEAKRSLLKKIKGYTEEEVKTVYTEAKEGQKPKIKETTRTKKHFQPDSVSIIFALTNKAPDEYKHRQSVDAKVDMSAKVEQLTEEQLNKVIDQVINESKS